MKATHSHRNPLLKRNDSGEFGLSAIPSNREGIHLGSVQPGAGNGSALAAR